MVLRRPRDGWHDGGAAAPVSRTAAPAGPACNQQQCFCPHARSQYAHNTPQPLSHMFRAANSRQLQKLSRPSRSQHTQRVQLCKPSGQAHAADALWRCSRRSLNSNKRPTPRAAPPCLETPYARGRTGRSHCHPSRHGAQQTPGVRGYGRGAAIQPAAAVLQAAGGAAAAAVRGDAAVGRAAGVCVRAGQVRGHPSLRAAAAGGSVPRGACAGGARLATGGGGVQPVRGCMSLLARTTTADAWWRSS
jgi:hypothetical protein